VRGSSLVAVIAAGLVFAPAAVAAVPTSTYSSGPLHVRVRPAGGVIGAARLRARGVANRIVVRVRVARPAGSRLRLWLVTPDGTRWRLPFRRRAEVGNGASGCRGSALRFDTSALRLGERFLHGWHGTRGRWRLVARGRGVVTCWQLWVGRGRPSFIRARTPRLEARLGVVELPSYPGYRLTVRRKGVRFGPLVVDRLCRDCVSMPSLVIRDLDADGEPELIANFWIGGAHCCFRSLIFRFRGRAGYEALAVKWAGEGADYRLRDLDRDRRPEFLTASDFECAFASCAGTVSPIRIFVYRRGRLLDVTGRFPGRVRREARGYRRSFALGARRRNELQYAALGAWVADQYPLGRGPAALRRVTRLESRTRAGRQFLGILRVLLHEWGYGRPGCPRVMCARLGLALRPG
jgi:hypothetical protein